MLQHQIEKTLIFHLGSTKRFVTPQKPQQKSALLKITALVTQLVTKLVTLLDIDVGEIRFQPLFCGELQYP